MIDPTTSLNAAGPCGLMLAADAASSAPSQEGKGFASALAQAGATAQDAQGAADATEAAPAIAAIAPVESDPAADALLALQPPVDISTTPDADVQALEASFESLAGLAHQLNGSHGDAPGAQANRKARPDTLNGVDSAIAALVEALQFAPRPDATVDTLADDTAPGIKIDDGGAVFGGDEADDSAEAPLIDPLIGAIPAPVPTPLPAGALPRGGPPLAAAPLPGETDPALAPPNERKSPGVDSRPGARSTLNPGRDRQAQGLQGVHGEDKGATAPRSTAAATEAVAKADGMPRIHEPHAVQAAARNPTESPFQALLGAATTGSSAAPTAASAPAPFQAQLSAAIDSPNFGAALGVQISTLADNGISEARLHLNPAELGPIAVQIGLDGTLAQVHMAVEHSSTRQALEQAMPELAAALRDAGFTMTGGGVSQQTREQQQQAAATAATGSRAGAGATADDALAALATPVRGARRGMLDVYA